MSSTVEVFTDGSCIKNGKTCAKAGYGIYFPNKELPSISRNFTHSPITNQRAELFAIYVALIIIKKVLTFDKIIIYTDSEYSINSLTKWIKNWIKNNWKSSTGKKVMNQDIIKPTYDIIQKLKDKKIKIEFIHVMSHTGKSDYKSVNNSIVDKLALSGALKIK